MKPSAPTGQHGRVRIIAGRLRGSRLDVAAVPGLRPTSDRVRETLFNWLAPTLPGANCLDLFAGSGALGFEAASRGAAMVQMIERDPRAVASLRANAQRLQAANVVVDAGDAIAWLQRPATRRFDLVFVDPPFAAALHAPALAALGPRLAAEAMVYVESGREAAPAPPASWRLHREGSTREVRYALYRLPPEAPATLPGDSPAQDSP
jgi:16S rRNA (guanine966-N2)-methyltransferase